jgi:ferredoxin
VIYRGQAGTGPTEALLAARVDEARCTGCGQCEQACPHHAAVVRIQLGGRAVSAVDRPACRGCGLCAAACAFGAIDLTGGHDAVAISRAICEVVP